MQTVNAISPNSALFSEQNVPNYRQLIIDRLNNAIASCNYITEADKEIAKIELNRLAVDLRYANKVMFYPHRALCEMDTPARILKCCFNYAAFDIQNGEVFWYNIKRALNNQQFTPHNNI